MVVRRMSAMELWYLRVNAEKNMILFFYLNLISNTFIQEQLKLSSFLKLNKTTFPMQEIEKIGKTRNRLYA